MKLRVVSVVVVAVMSGACSGGDDGDATAGSVDEWCSLAEQIARLEADDPGLLAVDGPARDDLARYRTLLGDAAAVAPGEVLADANAVADGVDQFVNVAESVDYDFDRLGEDELLAAAADLVELDEPIARVRTFNERECGLAAGATTPTTSATASPTTETAPSDPPSGTTPTTEPRATFTGDPDSEWCVRSRELNALSDQFGSMMLLEPDELEAFMADWLERVEAAAAVAPAELADAIEVSLDGFRSLDEAFAAAGYDAFDTDLSVLDADDPELAAANELIEQYGADVCGIDPAADVSDGDIGDFDPTAGTIREQAIAEFVALGFTEEEGACIFDNIDFSDPDVLNDTAAISEVLTECGIDFERLLDLE